MSSFGLLLNATLMFLGYLFVRLRPRGIWPFVLWIVLVAVYANGLPRIIRYMWWPDIAFHFAAAWGVGNVGLALILLSYFWIWGPVLTLIAAGTIPKFRS
jgi:hypothetical protein